MTIPCCFEHLQDSIPLFSVFIEAIESLFCISFLCKEWCNGSLPLQFYKFFADFYILSTHQDVFSFNILHISKIRLIFAAGEQTF